jgi:glycosyltransferase involved in cell wall biosynthesis
MRICLYTGTALPKLGGQEAVVDCLARQFLKQGHEPIVLAPRPRLPLRPDDAALPYRVLRHPRFYSTKHLVSWYQRWLRQAHRRYHFDVLHCHDVYPTGYLAALSQQSMGIPIVITSHGGDVREGNLRLSKPGMRPRFIRAVRSADALISIGRFTEEGFLRLNADANRIVSIPNGVELEPLTCRASRPQDLDTAIVEDQYILFLGRLALRKGVDTLLEAMSRIKPNGHVQLVIAGSGDEREAIERMVDQLNMRQRVRLVGRVEGAAKAYLLQNARCTVMPSRGWEAFPLVVLESYAAGRPVVGTAIAGLEDLIEHEHNGLLVKPDSPVDLAAALTRVLEDDAWLNRASAAARQSTEGYGWDSIARRHVELYARLIAAHSA